MRFPANLVPSEPQGHTLLAHERARATFDAEPLTQFIIGPEMLHRQRTILPILAAEPAFDKSKRYYSSRPERLQHAFRKEKRLVELSRIHGWTDADIEIAEHLLDEPGPLALHRSMFLPTLHNQGTDAQRIKFEAPARDYRIIGCYAQTELGHGSNLQGLETTATYDPTTREFIIHSPDLTASKWWIGGLGLAATHAVVMARLSTQGRDHGPHPFVVPIRSLKDHSPLPGVTVGDVGPKFGFNSVDNGWVLFDHVRIPQDHMLARYASVDPSTGAYSTPPSSKLAYGTMVLIRANIVKSMGFYLARATTIATRYSAIRRQFADPTNPNPITVNGSIAETPVIEYTMQQYRLFPLIAHAYALILTGRRMFAAYEDCMSALEAGDLGLLADVHASSSGLKSLTSTLALDGIEVCRRACGGHGYSAFSGLPTFYADVLPNVTWEGDNYLLTQQTGRYLLKTLGRVAAHLTKDGPREEGNDTFDYLLAHLVDPAAAWPVSTEEDLLKPEVQLAAFTHRSARLIQQAAQRLAKGGRSWNDELIEISRISRAHCQYILARNFIAALDDPALSPALRPTLKQLSDLFALWTLEHELGDLLQYGYASSQQATLLRRTVRNLLPRIRPDAVALVDAFAIPDFLLNSALGRYDGRVYEAMTDMAAAEPENQVDVTPNYEECLKPLIDGSVAAKFKTKL